MRAHQANGYRATRSGFVLPAVLGAMLVITVVSFAMSLVAALELMAARSASEAVTARAMADSTLALALAEARRDLTTAAATLTTSDVVAYGPWPQYEVAGSAALEQLTAPAEGQGSVYRLTAGAGSGKALATAGLVFTLEPQLLVLERTR